MVYRRRGDQVFADVAGSTAVQDPAPGEHFDPLAILRPRPQSPPECSFVPMKGVFDPRLLRVSRVHSPLPLPHSFPVRDVRVALCQDRVARKPGSRLLAIPGLKFAF
jgi:hypothetical protein